MLKFVISDELKDIYYALKTFGLEIDVKIEFKGSMDGEGTAECTRLWRYVTIDRLPFWRFEIRETENGFYVGAESEEKLFSLSENPNFLDFPLSAEKVKQLGSYSFDDLMLLLYLGKPIFKSK